MELNYRLGFSGRVLTGNVHVRRNVALECQVIGAKCDAIFPIGSSCASLAPFLDIPEVELKYRLNMFGRVVAGNALFWCEMWWLYRNFSHRCVFRMLNVEC